MERPKDDPVEVAVLGLKSDALAGEPSDRTDLNDGGAIDPHVGHTAEVSAVVIDLELDQRNRGVEAAHPSAADQVLGIVGHKVVARAGWWWDPCAVALAREYTLRHRHVGQHHDADDHDGHHDHNQQRRPTMAGVPRRASYRSA